jgi:hypothetical protein
MRLSNLSFVFLLLLKLRVSSAAPIPAQDDSEISSDTSGSPSPEDLARLQQITAANTESARQAAGSNSDNPDVTNQRAKNNLNNAIGNLSPQSQTEARQPGTTVLYKGNHGRYDLNNE